MYQDKQDVIPVAYCVGCGGEIYPGEVCWEVDEGLLHIDHECVADYISEHWISTQGGADTIMRLIGAGGRVTA